MKTYVYPKFSTLGAFGFRTGGPGLGNLFFAYARALLIAKERGFALVNPTWLSIKIGPYLRREREKRLYLQIFNRQGISGVRKTLLLLTRRKVDEASAAGMDAKALSGAIVTTTGLGGLFKDIAHERPYLAAQFGKLLRGEDNMRIRAAGPFGIGVHIRMGDFPQHMRVPLSWYVQTIEKMRRATGLEVPVTVVSDGGDAELAELLQLPGVRRLALGAHAELFALSASKIILASDSTFSAWAAFLGRVPILWGKRDPSLEGIFNDGTINEIVPEEAPLPSRAGEYLRQVFK